MRLLDSSVVLASLLEAEPHHEACGAQGLRVGADLAQQLLRESVLPYVKTVTLAERDVMAALAQAQSRGVPASGWSRVTLDGRSATYSHRRLDVLTMVVHALNDRTRDFYQHDGFQGSPLHPMTMMLRLG
jgi:hypothetical protein